MLLKLYIYGYLNRVQSSRRLEREAGRNVEVMWLTGRLVPDHKTIADFRKDNGPAIRKVCARFVELCRSVGLLVHASVAIDGSKFKAVNNRDRNFTTAKMKRRQAQIEESITRYLHQLDSADRQDPSPALAKRVSRLEEKIGKLKDEMARLEALDAERQTDGIDLRRYAAKECGNCMLKTRCTTSTRHVVTRWEHEHLAEEVQRRSTSRDSGASFRHHQDAPGCHPLPDEAAEERAHRDGAKRPGLQFDPGHDHSGAATTAPGDEGIKNASLSADLSR